MPAQYEAIRDEKMKEGMSEKEAKSHAAAIFIARGKGGKGKKGRKARARALHSDKNPFKGVGK